MAKNKIQDLRDHLFEIIEMLKDEDSSMTLEKAKTIADVSQVIINSAKLEVDFIKAIDKSDGYSPSSSFFDPENKKYLTK